MPEDRALLARRPTPEALVTVPQREESRQGRLKIFVGAAPGVGKTYEMLQTAAVRKSDGYDVVVGVVETHGRKETEGLLGGLETIPRRTLDYKGRQLEEMDLDAILTRRPQIVLVDDLAHTNAEGSRHPKRYLDVLELLEQGINVYTTINIQHIESLNDVVAQITHVRVLETVPDSIFNRADDVKLVDLTPEDLIRRLKEGKVYVPAQAEQTLEHFFSPAKLTALRELALRRTAQRVDEQLLEEMQARAIEGPWAAGERILVCVGEDPRAAGLVRYAKRLADRLHAAWTVLYVETPRSLQLSEAQRDRIANELRLAEGLGAQAVTLPGAHRRIAADILDFAHANNITQVILGRARRSRWFEIINGSVVHDLVQGAGKISVHVIAADELTGADLPAKTVHAAPVERAQTLLPYAAALAAVAAALAVSFVVESFSGAEGVDLPFLVAIIAVAARFGLWPSLLASIVAALFYNFFFFPPILGLTVVDPRNVATVIFFTAGAIVVSNLAARTRIQAVTAINRARTTESLHAFSQKLAGARSLDDVLWAAAYQTALLLKVHVVFLLSEDGTLTVKAGYPPEDSLDDSDIAAAKWAWHNNQPAGRGADTLPDARRLFLPVRTGRGPVGVVGIDSEREGPLFTADQRRLLDALMDQTAVAVERVRVVDDMDRVQREVEAERLRSALLTSISHDLRTPLSAVIGTAETLRDMSGELNDAEKAELLSQVIDEGERLARFISNLLDMTKLESGAVVADLSPHDLSDVVDGALRRSSKMLACHHVKLDLAPELPMVELDPVLFERVVFNLLDNAAKYAPAGSTISIVGRQVGETVSLQVADEGEGVPPADLEQVFDKFYRANKGDRVRPGTGLGLAISRGFVEAMHGTITAANQHNRKGAVFTVTLQVFQSASEGALS